MQKRRQQMFPSSYTEKGNYLQSLKLKYTQENTYNPTLYNTKIREDNLNNIRKLSAINQNQTQNQEKTYNKLAVLKHEPYNSHPYQNYKSVQTGKLKEYDNSSNYATSINKPYEQESTLNTKRLYSPVGKIYKSVNRLSYQPLPPKQENQQPENQQKFDSPIKRIYDEQKQNTKREQVYRSRSCFGLKETTRMVSTKRQSKRITERQKDMSAISKVDNILLTIRRTLAI